jgi:hypothetical protein
VGLGIPGMQSSDAICVFESAAPLFVLRTEENRMPPLIGDAFIYRLMEFNVTSAELEPKRELFTIL